ncbi:unnamed protein product [Rotaria sp. Silwood2]|nr:unnamed protein product [Rotaria sp. Silwood2]
MEHTKKLNEFYCKFNQHWELIYKTPHDDFDAKTFHSRYTAIPWTSDNSNKSDTTAFLFTLTNPHGIPPTKYCIDPPKA